MVGFKQGVDQAFHYGPNAVPPVQVVQGGWESTILFADGSRPTLSGVRASG